MRMMEKKGIEQKRERGRKNMGEKRKRKGKSEKNGAESEVVCYN